MKHELVNLLRKLGVLIEDESPDVDYGYSNGTMVLQGKDGKFWKAEYRVDSYGGDMSFDRITEVKPKTVEKVVYE